MGNINDNTRIKKLYKSGGSGQVAVKGGDGEVVVSKERITELNSLNDISELFNDDGLYQANKHLLRQVEDMRLDIEELHSFIKGAFGKSPVKKSNVVLNETLTQNETKYLKELIEDTGGGQFTSDIMDEVPSLKIIDNKITIDKKDIDSLSNFLDDMYISDLAPSGRGVDKMPPRLRDANNNLLTRLLRSEQADGGRMDFLKGGLAKILEL